MLFTWPGKKAVACLPVTTNSLRAGRRPTFQGAKALELKTPSEPASCTGFLFDRLRVLTVCIRLTLTPRRQTSARSLPGCHPQFINHPATTKCLRLNDHHLGSCAVAALAPATNSKGRSNHIDMQACRGLMLLDFRCAQTWRAGRGSRKQPVERRKFQVQTGRISIWLAWQLYLNLRNGKLSCQLPVGCMNERLNGNSSF